jgi:hypothetical protein
LNHPEPLISVAATTLQIIMENKHYFEDSRGGFTMVDGTDIGRIAYLLDIFSAMGIRERGLRRALQNSKNVNQFLRILERFDLTGLVDLCTRIVATEDCSVKLSDFMRQAHDIVTVLMGELRHLQLPNSAP